MREIIIGLVLSMALVDGQSNAQTRFEEHSADPALIAGGKNENPSESKWIYRSYRNQPEVLIGADSCAAREKAFKMIFGEGVMSLDNTDKKQIKGTFDMGSGYVLDLEGTATQQNENFPAKFVISGKGRNGTPTAGWQYDYVGYSTFEWSNGIDQVPAIVGTVIRAKPHGEAKAGYVASFIATKQP